MTPKRSHSHSPRFLALLCLCLAAWLAWPDGRARTQSAPDEHATQSRPDDQATEASPEPGLPDLTGLEVNEARHLLRERGLEVELDGSPAAPVAELMFRVAGQRPAPGAALGPGDRVVVKYFGQPPEEEQVELPSMVAKPETQARQTLTELGLRVEVLIRPTDIPSQEGMVLSQSPLPGQVKAGSRVSLAVARYIHARPRQEHGPAVPVPPVAGKRETQARQILEQAGFKVRLDSVLTLQPSRDRMVQGTQPPAGRHASRGQMVVLTVYRYRPPDPNQLPVPRVVGLTVSQARAALIGASFEVREARRANAKKAEEDRVAYQHPAPSEYSPRGSVVLVVANGPAAEPGATVKTVIIPNLQGQDEAAARRMLEQAGIGVAEVQYVPASTTAKPGQVVRQGPRPGARLLVGRALAYLWVAR